MRDPLSTHENLDKDITSENRSPLLKEEEKSRDRVPDQREQNTQQDGYLLVGQLMTLTKNRILSM